MRDLDEKISGEEMDLLKKKQNLEEKEKERRNAKVEEGRDKATAGGGATRQAVAGSRISATMQEWETTQNGCKCAVHCG